MISRGHTTALVCPTFDSIIWSIIFIVLATLSLGSQAATFKVTPDRDEVSLNDSFTIFFQAVGSVDDDPDFSALEKDFSILNRQKRSNLSIIHGTRTSTNVWLVEVMPKRDGLLIIPSIAFGKDQTPEAKVLVKNVPTQAGKADQNDEIFIEIEAVPEQTWVQAQIIYTIRLFRSVNTFNSSLSEPTITRGQMIVEKLEDRQYETSRNNKRYIVLQRRYALFPQASGEFTIEPILFTGQVSQQSRNLFDPFGRSSRTVQRFSRAISLHVKPVPSDFTGQTWLPARKLDISEKWMKDVLKLEAGEPVTRTIVIKADGLSSEQLPQIVVTEMDGFKIYPDQPELHNQTSRDGVLGIRQEKSAIIPNKAGEYVLPALEMKWWNTLTGKMEIAQLPERVINVIPSTSVGQVEAEGTQNIQQDPVDDLTLNTTTAVHTSTGYWPWISFVLGLGWLVTLIAWWKTRQTKTVIENSPDQKISERSSLRMLREKIQLNEPIEIKDALMV